MCVREGGGEDQNQRNTNFRYIHSHISFEDVLLYCDLQLALCPSPGTHVPPSYVLESPVGETDYATLIPLTSVNTGQDCSPLEKGAQLGCLGGWQGLWKGRDDCPRTPYGVEY